MWKTYSDEMYKNISSCYWFRETFIYPELQNYSHSLVLYRCKYRGIISFDIPSLGRNENLATALLRFSSRSSLVIIKKPNRTFSGASASSRNGSVFIDFALLCNYFFNSSVNILLRIFGLALPFVTRIPCPIKNCSEDSLPDLYSSTTFSLSSIIV